MNHVPWTCDDCHQPQTKITWFATDERWRCDGCAKKHEAAR